MIPSVASPRAQGGAPVLASPAFPHHRFALLNRARPGAGAPDRWAGPCQSMLKGRGSKPSSSDSLSSGAPLGGQ
eukprot:15481681-Alexandrium_andersonii.AAC.1